MRWQASFIPLLIAAAPFEQSGAASWYGHELAGNRTANGERFDPEALTAAHRTLPLGSWAEVTALDTGRTVRVRINDRGPYHGNRVIDVSAGAARRLGLMGKGARHVRIRRVLHDAPAPAPLAPVARARAEGHGRFFVQLASFESRTRAASLAERHGGAVERAGALWRVRVGPLDGARATNAALAKLEREGYSGAIVTR